MHIQPLDYLLCYKGERGTSEMDPYKAEYVQGFATLNGLRIDLKRFPTQASFEDQFRVIGPAMRGMRFGKADQPETGVAAMVHGSKNFFYRGFKGQALYPGDRFCWRLPSIFLEQRERERSLIGADNEHPEMREAVIIEPLSYDRAHHFVQHELTRSFDKSSRDRYLFTRTKPGANDSPSRDQFAAIALRSLLQLNAFFTLAFYSLYTGQPLVTPGGGAQGSAVNDQDFNLNVAAEETYMKDLVSGSKRIVPQPNGTLQVSDQPLSDAEKKARAYQLEFWAAKIGCAPNAKGPAGRHHHNLINAILASTYQPLLMDRGLAQGVSVLKLFTPEMQATAKRSVSRNIVEREWNPQSVVGQLGYLQSSAATDAYKALGEAIERVQDKCLGTCLSYTVPSDWGDEFH